MDGQAQAPESNSVSDLAAYLSDTPIEETEEELTAEESTKEGDDSTADPQTDEVDESEEDSKDEPEEESTKPTTEEIEVTVKGDDGSDTKLKVTKDELIKGYQRQADYTRKTQALGEREVQAIQVFQQKHGELRDTYLQRSEFATQAIAQLAGFRSDAEMAQLAAQDPATWVQENQRQNQIRQILGTLEQQTQAERNHAEAQAKQRHEAQLENVKAKTWEELTKVGVDAAKLRNTYDGIIKNYGYKPDDFANVTDHRLVKMMIDAVAYRELKSKAPAVTQQAKDSPRMPNKQTNAVNDRQSQAINSRFNSGKAKTRDLAAYLATLN